MRASLYTYLKARAGLDPPGLGDLEELGVQLHAVRQIGTSTGVARQGAGHFRCQPSMNSSKPRWHLSYVGKATKNILNEGMKDAVRYGAPLARRRRASTATHRYLEPSAMPNRRLES